jgi:hypothetical protein
MDRNEIDDVVHEISMMVEVLLGAVVKLQAPAVNPDVFIVSRAAGERISFAAFDIDKRVKALRDGLDMPAAKVVRIGGKECA